MGFIMHTKPTPRAWRVFAYLLFSVNCVVSGAYFGLTWAIHAEGLGAHDMGISLAAAFYSAGAIYASSALIVLTLIAGLIGALLRFYTLWLWLALVVAALPMGSLFVRG